MQTQDAPAEFIFKLWPWLEANRIRLIALAAAIGVGVLIYSFVSSQRAQKEITAGEALTQLSLAPNQTPESLVKVADEFSGTAAGERARLQAGAALFDAGRYADARAQFQKFLESSSSGQLAATAQLGIAASLDADGKTSEAAPAYQKVASSYSSSTCVSPAEFALGRITEQQGKFSEAMGHYESAARSGIGGTLAQEAAGRAMEIKSKLAAAKPAAPAATAAMPLITPAPVAK